MIVTDKKLFIRFLKENKAYIPYMSITRNKFVKVINSVSLHGYIHCGFAFKGWVWSNTEQGVTYWTNLNAEWLCYICKNYDDNSYIDNILCPEIKLTLRYEHAKLNMEVKNKLKRIVYK